MVISAVLISVSTTFVKQHSAVDVLFAVPLGLLAEFIVFGRFPAGKTRLQAWLERDAV